MRTKVKGKREQVSTRKLRRVLLSALVFLTTAILLNLLSRDQELIEYYYSKGFYPIFSVIPKYIFGWLPWSIGDVLYTLLVVIIMSHVISMLLALARGKGQNALVALIRLSVFVLAIYSYFYISWGQNYFRVPLQKQFSLEIQDITKDEYVNVVGRYIDSLNNIRERVDIDQQSRGVADKDIEELLLNSEKRFPMLSRAQVKVKHPISSHIISFFTVSGYFNPFTQEVQVNQLIPKASYPFTVAHELAHQMGIGLEDECNFVAFLALRDHENLWYRYAAYYQTVQYLLRPLYYQDQQLYNYYLSVMSDRVKGDYQTDQNFWKRYQGWVNALSDRFYGNYLRYNNQPEGFTRYTLMGRLVVAWETQKKVSQEVSVL